MLFQFVICLHFLCWNSSSDSICCVHYLEFLDVSARRIKMLRASPLRKCFVSKTIADKRQTITRFIYYPWNTAGNFSTSQAVKMKCGRIKYTMYVFHQVASRVKVRPTEVRAHMKHIFSPIFCYCTLKVDIDSFLWQNIKRFMVELSDRHGAFFWRSHL